MAAMQPIAEWLDKLGLGHYAQRFVENGVDLSDLPLKVICPPLRPI
jgi:SAM domain (Sterile alpha motif)